MRRGGELTGGTADPGRGASWRVVARDVGGLQMLTSAAMLASLAVCLIYGETHSALAFLASAAITGGGGWALARRYRDAGDPRRRDALTVAGAGWLASAVLGALPFLLAAYLTPDDVARSFVPAGESHGSSLRIFRDPLHALFESMSAYTTTGLTLAVHEPSIGHGLLFYRSLAQWIGGAGMIVLSLAVLHRSHAIGGLELYQSETTGTKLRPTVIGTARAIWRTYAILTLSAAAYLFVVLKLLAPERGTAENLFDAVNHAMTSLATGGFSTLDDGIAGYGSRAIELAHVLPMLVGTLSLPLCYEIARQRRLGLLWKDTQVRAILVVIAVVVPALALILGGASGGREPWLSSLFHVVSAMSTTGWQTAELSAWSDSAVLTLCLGAMLVGGSAGATVGGIKLIRAILLLKAAAWRIRGVFRPPDAVIPFRLGDRSLPAATMKHEVADAAVLAFLFLIVLAVSVVVVSGSVGEPFTLADVVLECTSAQTSAGLSSGITDPGMPRPAEIVFILQMWIGRLEIFPVIVLLRALVEWTVRR